MKHLATIQSEFLKAARDWEEMSYDEQKEYLQKHRKSKRKMTAKPESKSTGLKEKLKEKKENLKSRSLESMESERWDLHNKAQEALSTAKSTIKNENDIDKLLTVVPKDQQLDVKNWLKSQLNSRKLMKAVVVKDENGNVGVAAVDKDEDKAWSDSEEVFGPIQKEIKNKMQEDKVKREKLIKEKLDMRMKNKQPLTEKQQQRLSKDAKRAVKDLFINDDSDPSATDIGFVHDPKYKFSDENAPFTVEQIESGKVSDEEFVKGVIKYMKNEYLTDHDQFNTLIDEDDPSSSYFNANVGYTKEEFIDALTTSPEFKKYVISKKSDL